MNEGFIGAFPGACYWGGSGPLYPLGDGIVSGAF